MIDRAARLLKTLAIQYLHLLETLLTIEKENSIDLDGILPVHQLSWSRFLWAQAILMTRQNHIPSGDQQKQQQLALIPAWDMTNHCDDRSKVHIDSWYNMENQCLEAVVTGPLQFNHEVLMYYGDRSIYDLFLFCGFVPSTAKPLNEVRLNINCDGNMALMPFMLPIHAEGNKPLFQRITQSKRKNASDVDMSAVKEYLLTKCQVLIRFYDRFLQQYLEAIQNPDNSPSSRNRIESIFKYRKMEVKFLESAVKEFEAL